MPLCSVLIALVSKGARFLGWRFFTTLPQLPSLLHLNAVGGIGNAIVATLVIDLLAGLVAVPIGVILGLFWRRRRRGPATSCAPWSRP